MTAQGARDWIALAQEIVSERLLLILMVTLILLYLVEKSSIIKARPYTAMFQALGRSINGEIIKRIDGIDKRIDSIEDTLEADRKAEGERNAKAARVRILRFNGELIRHVRHTKEEFSNVLKDVDEYERYCRDHEDFPNNEAVLSIENIRTQYRKCLEQGDFLPEVMA